MYTRNLLLIVLASLSFVLKAQEDNNFSNPTCPVDEVTVKVIHVDDGVKVNEFPPIDPPTNPPEDATGDRYVYFAHGHTGNETSWITAHSHVLQRSQNDWLRIKRAFNPSYPSLIGLENGYTVWESELKTRSECEADDVEITENIVVAHSFGGLIGKYTYGQQVLRNFPPEDRAFGGMITFDTPHAGAPFANNIANLGDFVSTGCEDLLEGPLIEGIQNTQILPFFVSPSSVSEITAELCGGIGGIVNTLVPFAAGPADPSFNGTLVDLRPGSDAILETDALTQIPNKIAVTSNETQEDLVWRSVWWASMGTTTAFDFGESNTDGPLIASAAMWEAWYADRGMNYTAVANNLRCGRFWWGAFISTPAAAALVIICNNTQNQLNAQAQASTTAGRAGFRRGSEWFQTADERYKVLAGFKEVTFTPNPTANACECFMGGLSGTTTSEWRSLGANTSASNCALACANYPWAGPNPYVITTRFDDEEFIVNTRDLDNDGIVPVESQGAWNGAFRYNYDGSNHFQIRSDRNTANAFERAFTNGEGRLFFRSTQ